MKVNEIRELTQDEIKTRIDDSRRNIVEMRFQLAMRKLESPAKLRAVKRHLAQLLTIQTEKVRGTAGKADVPDGQVSGGSNKKAPVKAKKSAAVKDVHARKSAGVASKKAEAKPKQPKAKQAAAES